MHHGGTECTEELNKNLSHHEAREGHEVRSADFPNPPCTSYYYAAKFARLSKSSEIPRAKRAKDAKFGNLFLSFAVFASFAGDNPIDVRII